MLYVSQLNPNESIESLDKKVMALFEQRCDVVSVEVRKSFSGEYSYAFIEIKDPSKVVDLINELNGFVLDGRKIIVEKKRSSMFDRRFTKSPPRGAKSCYKCGKPGHFARDCFPKEEEDKKLKEDSKHKKHRRERESSSSESEEDRHKHEKTHRRTRDKKFLKKKKHYSESSS